MIKIIKFGVNGIIMSLFCITLTNFFDFFIENKIVPYSLAYFICIIINYFVSSKFVFKATHSRLAMFHFIFSQLIGLVIYTSISLFSYNLLLKYLNINYLTQISQITGVGVSAIFSFIYSSFITFKNTNAK